MHDTPAKGPTMYDPYALGPLVIAALLTGRLTGGVDLDRLLPPWRDLADAIARAPAGTPPLDAYRAALSNLPDAVEINAAVLAVHRHGPDAAPWGPPIPFEDRRLPPFPTRALPPWLADCVAALSRATQTPPDLAGILALAVLSTACARSAVVRPWGDWIEPTNLYTMVVLPPGHRKSAVVADAVRPVQAFEAELARRLVPAIARAESERAVALRALRRAEEAVARASPDDPARPSRVAEAARRVDELAACAVPPRPRLLVDDCSPERLATLLEQQGGRIAVLSPEGGIFDLMAGRYSSAAVPNVDHFLKGHAGDPIVVDRVGRSPELVERPAITMGLAVQPEVLRGLMARPGFRGRGLLARFFYALPASPLGRRTIRPAPVPQPVRDAYDAGVGALLASSRDVGAEPLVLSLTRPAAARLAAFAAAVEPRLSDLGDLAPLPDWGGKLVGLVARLAALLHLATSVGDRTLDTPISEGAAGSFRQARSTIEPETVDAAVALGKYATAHARAAYAAMGGDPVADDARYLLATLVDLGKPALRKQQIWQATRGRFRHTRVLDAALAILVEHAYLRERTVDSRLTPNGQAVRGRKPAPTYLLNPLATAPRPPHTS